MNACKILEVWNKPKVDKASWKLQSHKHKHTRVHSLEHSNWLNATKKKKKQWKNLHIYWQCILYNSESKFVVFSDHRKKKGRKRHSKNFTTLSFENYCKNQITQIHFAVSRPLFLFPHAVSGTALLSHINWNVMQDSNDSKSMPKDNRIKCILRVNLWILYVCVCVFAYVFNQ